jgi:hypothetical protein
MRKAGIFKTWNHPRSQGLARSSWALGYMEPESARKVAVVPKEHALELERFSTHNNFHIQVLRRNEVFVFPSENCSTSAK